LCDAGITLAGTKRTGETIIFEGENSNHRVNGVSIAMETGSKDRFQDGKTMCETGSWKEL
jgi:hypothetical protein